MQHKQEAKKQTCSSSHSHKLGKFVFAFSSGPGLRHAGGIVAWGAIDWPIDSIKNFLAPNACEGPPIRTALSHMRP